MLLLSVSQSGPCTRTRGLRVRAPHPLLGARPESCRRASRTFLGRGLMKTKMPMEISEFQEKHRKRLLTFYREKITKLEESLRKSVLRMEQLQSMRSSQQTAFSAIKTPVSTPSAKPGGHPLLPLDSSASDRVEFMQVDHTPSPMRKPEVAVGPARISLISPPQHGRMGSISRLGPTPGHSSVSQALRIPLLPVPCKALSPPAAPLAPGRAGRGGSPSLRGSQTLAPRPPISISALLQKQRLGSAGLGAATHGR
nr:probable E3 SUMO-protein ligase RNF212 isoform X4 [Mirounga angustirostris]